MRILKYLVILSTIFASSISSAGTLVVNSNQSGESSEAAFNAYVAAFEAAHPDIDVQVNLTEHEAYKTAIRNFLVAEAPDVAIWFAGNRMKFFVDQDLFMDVSDVWADADLNNIMSSSKASLTVSPLGRVFIWLPWRVQLTHTGIFVFNAARRAHFASSALAMVSQMMISTLFFRMFAISEYCLSISSSGRIRSAL